PTLPRRRLTPPQPPLAAALPPPFLPPTTVPMFACSSPNPPTIHRGGGHERKVRSRSMAAAALLNVSISARPSDLPSPVPSLKFRLAVGDILTELAGRCALPRAHLPG
ncbi:unnamed protein product, partial [Urochloa humidicola]